MEVLTKTTLEVTLQYIHLTNRHVVHLKFTCFVCQLHLNKSGNNSNFLGLTPVYQVYINKIHYQHCLSEQIS